ncbi:MAG: FAD/NAD(P)-binding oxidoreductase [Spirochaetae bacterium HGW-Spirochaetae-3]|jgi:glycerol-3-phosphate dehydrogenase|nr:MAG: FAD/NAD(P)-binding oxidoreductase [Spirochaetae bacterium HGW-Spirochaetae-3]
MYDIAIIGAGVVGASIARELARYDLKIVLLEKGGDVASGASKANSAIIHAGYDAEYGTAMGELNVEGNKLYGQVCEELAIPFRRAGSFVCALGADELPALERLLENGKRLGVPDLVVLSRDEALRIEPNLTPSVAGALYAPTAGILMPWEVAIAYAENAVDNGAELMLDAEVLSIEARPGSFSIRTRKGTLAASRVVNCAGVYADSVYAMVEPEPEFSINPRRGQYYLLDKTAEGLVNTVLFPAPSKLGKGILVAPTYDGNVIVGPDAEDLPPEERGSTATSAEGLERVRDMARRLVPGIPFNTVITNFAGVRAQPSTGDFIIGEARVRGFYNVAGIKSPGLSSAPAIAKRVAEMVTDSIPGLKARKGFDPRRRPRVNLGLLGDAEKAELIRREPSYGNVVCRCESISEGEILDAIRRSAGATTLNGVKRRVRPGAGRCQGGFCGPRVLAILARERGIGPAEVRMEALESAVLFGALGKEEEEAS